MLCCIGIKENRAYQRVITRDLSKKEKSILLHSSGKRVSETVHQRHQPSVYESVSLQPLGPRPHSSSRYFTRHQRPFYRAAAWARMVYVRLFMDNGLMVLEVRNDLFDICS
jgi:hypothetical protein